MHAIGTLLLLLYSKESPRGVGLGMHMCACRGTSRPPRLDHAACMHAIVAQLPSARLRAAACCFRPASHQAANCSTVLSVLETSACTRASSPGYFMDCTTSAPNENTSAWRAASALMPRALHKRTCTPRRSSGGDRLGQHTCAEAWGRGGREAGRGATGGRRDMSRGGQETFGAPTGAADAAAVWPSRWVCAWRRGAPSQRRHGSWQSSTPSRLRLLAALLRCWHCLQVPTHVHNPGSTRAWRAPADLGFRTGNPKT